MNAEHDFFFYLASILRNILKQFKEEIISVMPRRRTDLTVTSSTALMQYNGSSACISVLFHYTASAILCAPIQSHLPAFIYAESDPARLHCLRKLHSHSLPHRLHKMLNKLALGAAMELWLPSAVKAIRVREFKPHLCICVQNTHHNAINCFHHVWFQITLDLFNCAPVWLSPFLKGHRKGWGCLK